MITNSQIDLQTNVFYRTSQVCLGPVTDQSRGNRVIMGFVQGFGISGLFSKTKNSKSNVENIRRFNHVVWKAFAGPRNWKEKRQICWTDDQGPAVFTK